MLARMTHLEIYVDFGRFRWWRCGLGWQDAEIRGVSDQVGELLRMWNEQSTTERESCRIVIEDNNNWVSPILRLSFLDAVRRLVGLRSPVVIVLTNKPDLRKLGTCLASSLGPSTVHCEWPVLGPLDRHYGSVMFQPREFLAGRQR